GIARRAHVANEFDVAPERQPGDLPASALPVGPADQLASEADGKGLRRNAEQPPDEIVAELMEEDERSQRANERDEDQPERRVGKHQWQLSVISASTRERAARSTSITCSMDAGAGSSDCCSARSTHGAISAKRSRSARKAATATSFAALRTIGAAPPASSAWRARFSAGKRQRSGFSKSSLEMAARSSRCAGVSIRCGQASA